MSMPASRSRVRVSSGTGCPYFVRYSATWIRVSICGVISGLLPIIAMVQPLNFSSKTDVSSKEKLRITDCRNIQSAFRWKLWQLSVGQYLDLGPKHFEWVVVEVKLDKCFT